MSKPLAIDLFCGLGGWTEGLLAEDYEVIGFDIERHVYGEHQYPAQLVLQDVLTIHGKQFASVNLIVASPPCQEYSYMAMPWSRAKQIRAEYLSGERDRAKLTALFDACFRIQREACEAAGRHIPMVVENVRGAQEWVGRSRWNYGSFHLWGDVPALMPMTGKRSAMKAGVTHRADGTTNFHKVPGFRFDGNGGSFQSASVEHVKVGGIDFNGYGTPGYKAQAFNTTGQQRLLAGQKNSGGSWFNIGSPGQTEMNRNPVHALSGIKNGGRLFPNDYADIRMRGDGIKQGGTWWHDPGSASRTSGSKSSARKFASAMIAKIPLPLSRHIARTWRPV